MSSTTKPYEEKMSASVNHLVHELAAIRAGRANPAVLDKVTVDYYGVPTPVAQMAGVSVPDARTLLIQPWDGSTLKAIEKAILASDLGITPNNDGKVIRMAFPPLTEERRKEIVKSVHKLEEECKVAIRSIRRDAIDKFKAQKKAGELSEDDLKDLEKGIQKLTDTYCDKAEAAAKGKEKEIMEI